MDRESVSITFVLHKQFLSTEQLFFGYANIPALFSFQVSFKMFSSKSVYEKVLAFAGFVLFPSSSRGSLVADKLATEGIFRKWL